MSSTPTTIRTQSQATWTPTQHARFGMHATKYARMVARRSQIGLQRRAMVRLPWHML